MQISITDYFHNSYAFLSLYCKIFSYVCFSFQNTIGDYCPLCLLENVTLNDNRYNKLVKRVYFQITHN